MTYRELLKTLSGFTPEQLDAEVRWWGEERGGKIKSVSVLEEDYGSFDGEPMEPVSTYADDPDMKPDLVLPKGTPILDDEI